MPSKYDQLNLKPLSAANEAAGSSSAVQSTKEYNFGASDALKFLMQLDLPDEPVMPVPEDIKINGPDGFPYVACEPRIKSPSSVPSIQSVPVAVDNSRGNFIQSLLNEGFGMTLWRGSQKEPTWVYQYRDLLCYKLFGSLQPPPEFDEKLHADTATKPVPVNAQAHLSNLTDAFLPDYARSVLNRMIGTALGMDLKLDLHLVKFPEIDDLTRVALSLAAGKISSDLKQKVKQAASWCLPYVICLAYHQDDNPKMNEQQRLDHQQQASPNGPHVVLDYIAENSEKFIRIYDKDKEPMRGGWLYPQKHKTDQQLADEYAYLGYKNPHTCDVTIPSGMRIKGWAASNSNEPYMFQIESGNGVEFTNERQLPVARPSQEPSAPRLIADYSVDKVATFVRLYDREDYPMKGAWLFDPRQVMGKTPEQLKEFFDLPYVPKYICDVALPPNTKIFAYATHNVRRPNLYRVEGGATFSNERPL